MKTRLLSLLLLSVSAFGTTPVTGHIANLNTGTPGTSGFVRFILGGMGGNQPRITGTGAIAPLQGGNGLFYVDLPADASGNISGTIYSTRDAAGTGNGEIEVGGSYTAVYYRMFVYNNGIPGPEIRVHANNGVTLDISNVTPISTTPVVTAPTGDTTYCRIDGGNCGLTGPITSTSSISAHDFIPSSTPVRDVRAYGAVAGGEICTPLASALAAAHTAGGGRILVPLTGALTCTSNPFAALSGNQNIEIDWGAVTITTTAQWFINASGIVNRGIAWGSSVSNGLNAPTLFADGSLFPTSTALLKIGDNTSTLIFGTRFEDGWTFHCNNVAGCFVQLAGLNEKSGLRHVGIRNAGSGAAAQLVLDNSVVTSGHYVLEDVDFGPVTTGAIDAVLAKGGSGGGEGMFNIRRVTCNQTGQAFAGLACVHVTSTSPQAGLATLSDIHAEGFADTVYFDTNGYGEVYTADCTGSCTNVIHINSSAKISTIGLTASGGTNIVKNDNNACTVPQSELTLAAYFQNAGLSYIYGGASSAFGAVCSASTPRFRIASSTTSGAAGRTDFDQVYGATGSETGWRWEAPGSTDGGTAPYALKSVVNGVATQRFSFDNTGLFTATGNIQGVNLIVPGGGTAADFGDIRIRSTGTIRARNNAGSGNNILLGTDASDNELLYNVVKITATGSIDASAGTGFLKIKDQGSCTMSAGTCSAQSLGHTYTSAPNCFANWNNTGTLTGILKVPSTTTTVTPASSVGTDTAVVNWFCVGS